jgi:integrase
MNAPKKEKANWVKVAECLYRYRPSGSYFALLKVGGRQRRVNLQTHDLETARRKRDDEREKLRKTDQAKINRTVSEQVKLFLATKSLMATKTQQRYKRVLNALNEYEDDHGPEGSLGERKMAKIEPSTLERFHLKLVEGVSVGTSKEYLEVIKAFFKHAKKNKVIGDDPSDEIEDTREREDRDEKIPELEQVKRIITQIRNEPQSDTRDEAADFLTFLAGAGIGNGEAGELLVRDIDWKTNLIHFRRLKTKKHFDVPIYDSVRELLTRRCQGLQPDDRVFTLKNIKKSLATACQKLGYDHFTHRSFRKFFITLALDSGADPRVVAKAQGHKNSKLVLEVYSEVTKKKMQLEAAKVNFRLSS